MRRGQKWFQSDPTKIQADLFIKLNQWIVDINRFLVDLMISGLVMLWEPPLWCGHVEVFDGFQRATAGGELNRACDA